jgi:hypothetical protein
MRDGRVNYRKQPKLECCVHCQFSERDMGLRLICGLTIENNIHYSDPLCLTDICDKFKIWKGEPIEGEEV